MSANRSRNARRSAPEESKSAIAQKDKLREQFADKIGRPPQDGQRGTEELLRFELWEQQQCRCLYTGDYISAELIIAGDNAVQVDHILPWSRFGDDSFHNKTLCFARQTRSKKNRTPFEWFTADKSAEDWDSFVAAVKAIPYMKGMKRRNYLPSRTGRKSRSGFEPETSTTRDGLARLLAEALRQALPDLADPTGKPRRRVFVRPGALTDRLRRAWGLQWIKKGSDGKRKPDDRHHALDALIVAATTESLLNRATREVQQNEQEGRALRPDQEHHAALARVSRASRGSGRAGLRRSRRTTPRARQGP